MPLGIQQIISRVRGLGAGTPWFRKTLKTADFFSADVLCKAGEWTKFGDKQVPAQQEFQWGVGDQNHPENQGYVYVSLMTNDATPVQVDGTLRLIKSDANYMNREVIFEEHTATLRGSTTDKTMKVPLPQQGPIAKHNDRLLLELYPDSASDVTLGYDTGESVLYLPVSQRFVPL